MSQSPRIKKIHSFVQGIRLSEQMGVRAMQRWEELVYAKEEGFANGESKKQISVIINMLKENFPDDMIARLADCSIEDVLAVKKSM